ncbi:glycosyltransferase family 2 protein [Flavobacterium lacus]|uniref:Glycosyltransferase involved in cell wall biosynthesis n=1 Tax=Flavobacterium lacus TaxID=1353778 RepID=A0A328X731_9FLAO|nr:glycosyltransferase [Flavobacterium lacus]RAR51148.1 glycosyltransferase involved in cell wall biosynthesis [Flavobacterium lacus]
MVKVSVIIPVYNAEKHLTACIDSLLRQTLPELEFIFVNDGSRDTSSQIIASYQATDSRIILVNQDNQGVSVARNNGIALAQGNYIGFVDADDTIAPDFFEQLYTLAVQHHVDIVVSNFKREQGGHIIHVKSSVPAEKVLDKSYINAVLLPTFIQNSSLNTCWNKFYKKKLLHHYAITFPVGVALGEDGIFNILAFNNAQNVYFTNYSGYLYKEVDGSATRDLSKKDYFNRALEVYDFDYETILNTTYHRERLEEWRSIRLVENVLSYINIYLEPNPSISLKYGMRYVKKMITHSTVQNSILNYEKLLLQHKSSYQQFLLKSIKNKSVIALLLAVRYSAFRNKK